MSTQTVLDQLKTYVLDLIGVEYRDAATGSATAAAGSASMADTHKSAAAGSATAAGTSASNAGIYATGAASSATTAGQHKTAAATSSGDAAGSASAAHDDQLLAGQHRADADTARQAAQDAADGFGLTSTATTGAPGSIAVATVVRDGTGPAYTLTLQIPRGDKGEPGEISRQELENAVTAVHLALVGQAPETLRTIAALAESLGDDPDFATTVMALIAAKPSIGTTSTTAMAGDRQQLVDVLPTSPVPGVLYLIPEE